MFAERESWGVAISRGLFDPRLRLAWSAGSALGLVVLLVADWWARQQGWWGLAPAAEDFWLGSGLGAGLGVLMAAGERYELTRRRACLRAFHRAALPDRLTWEYQRGNLRANAWLLALTIALVGWCAYALVFPLGPLLAASAVFAAGNLRPAARFRAELGSREAAEPDGAPDTGRGLR